MNEKIYTIPVTDALKSGAECPFCAMKSQIDKDNAAFVMGPSYMERDLRAQTDAAGFCGKHARGLFGAKNALGLALMLQTRLLRVESELDKHGKPLAVGRCYICEKTEKTFALYVETFLILWEREKYVRDLTEETKGFCVAHLDRLLDDGAKKFSKKTFAAFRETLVNIEKRELKRLEDDIGAYVKLFDYQGAGSADDGVKTAPQRLITKLSSEIL